MNFSDKVLKKISKPGYVNSDVVENVKTCLSQVDNNIERHKTDEELKNYSCKRGCSFCCYYEINLSDDEYQLIRSKHGINVNELESIKKQNKLSWAQIPYKDRKCPFLINNECSIYEDRPLACRQHYVINLPQNCSEEDNIWHPRTIYQKFLDQNLNLMGFIYKHPRKSLSKHIIAELNIHQHHELNKKRKNKR